MYCTYLGWSSSTEVSGKKFISVVGLHLVIKALFCCHVICQLSKEKYRVHNPCQITPQLTTGSCSLILYTVWLVFQFRALLLGGFLHSLLPCETKMGMVWGPFTMAEPKYGLPMLSWQALYLHAPQISTRLCLTPCTTYSQHHSMKCSNFQSCDNTLTFFQILGIKKSQKVTVMF